MRATHTDYKHPRHLRVEDGANVWCMAPSASQYAKLNKPGLPKFTQPAPPLLRPIVFDYGRKIVE